MNHKSDIEDHKLTSCSLFKRISFLKTFLSQNLDFWILDFYAIFWLASEVAKYDVLVKSCKFMKTTLSTKVIYETLVNSIVLNKFSL